MRKLAYICNRYRTYDLAIYETLARRFALTVVWISPPPGNETVPADLMPRISAQILDSDSPAKLKPWHVVRGVKLLWLLYRLAGDSDLLLCTTSDSWKAKIAYLAARMRHTPIALRKERWLDLDVKLSLAARIYWAVDEFLTGHIDRNADAVLVGGSQARKYLLDKGISPSRILPFSYLHQDLAKLPLDPALQRDLETFFGQSLSLLYLGRIMPQKGLAELITATRAVIARGGDVKLLICGEPIKEKTGRGDPSSAYHDRCVELAAGEPRIRFFGPAPPDRVQDFYSAAAVLVHPHVHSVSGAEKHDGWGLVITEAASMSTAVMASDRVASAFDIVTPGESGFLLQSTDLVRELQRALFELVDKPELALELGHGARRHYEAVVDAQRTVASLENIIDGLESPEQEGVGSG